MSLRRWTVPLLAALALVPGHAALAGNKPSGDHVVLRSGKVLRGRVIATEEHAKNAVLRVETDFGEILIPQREVKRQVRKKKKAGAGDAVFKIHEVRVLQWRGNVERRAGGSSVWRKIGEGDRYTKAVETNRPNDLVKPGDVIRTGDDGTIDLVPHKDIWIRVAQNSEIEIPGPKVDASINLTRGTTIQKVREKPRGEVYRVKTPSASVDHVFVLGKKQSFFSVSCTVTTRLVVREGGARLDPPGIILDAGEAADAGKPKGPGGEWEVYSMPAFTPRFPVDDLVYVPAGRYRVGGHPNHFTSGGEASPPVESGCDAFDLRLKEYLIDRREVAAGEFYDFTVAWRPALPPGYPDYTRPAPETDRWPAVNQSWEAAELFARWCGKLLPTEAQWEVAGHGGEKIRFPWGNRVTREHQGLDRGRWGESLHVYESVDLVTADISRLGVRGLVSGAPEWCRDEWQASPFFAYLRIPRKKTGRAVRGALRNMRLRWRDRQDGLGKNAPGFRCVIELE